VAHNEPDIKGACETDRGSPTETQIDASFENFAPTKSPGNNYGVGMIQTLREGPPKPFALKEAVTCLVPLAPIKINGPHPHLSSRQRECNLTSYYARTALQRLPTTEAETGRVAHSRRDLKRRLERSPTTGSDEPPPAVRPLTDNDV
jgi:hypothetical protein